MNKSKVITTVGIILSTVVLAGIAIFTAIRLYQTRSTPVAPNAPESNPRAQEVNSCSLTFTISIPTASPTASPTSTATSTATATATATATSTAIATPTETASPTATATSNPICNDTCTSNNNCPSGLMCYIPSGSTSGSCRNTQCLSETDCSCAVATDTPTDTPIVIVSTPIETPTLPEVGTTWPTILGTGFGILVIIGSLLLAL